MSPNYRVSFDLAAKLSLSQGITREVFPLLNQTVRAIAQQVAINWKQAVLTTPKIWQGERDAYADSIKWSMTGDFTAVVETDYKIASEIETGRPARDLKKMLDTSLKVRRTENGRRFLVIPFRHGTPGAGVLAKPMPASVYKLAKSMAPSKVMSTAQRPSGEVTRLSPKTGMHPSGAQSPFLSNPKSKQAVTAASRQYAWGGRLALGAVRNALGPGPHAPNLDKRYAGMVKMETSTPGGSKSSSYMTFRIMMEGSKGWIIPSQPGKFIAKKVVDEMAPKAEAAFKAAVVKTLTG